MCYTSPYSNYENSIVGRLEDKDRWIKIEHCECPSPYINIYGLCTLLNTVDKNRIKRRQTNKISLLSNILQHNEITGYYLVHNYLILIKGLLISQYHVASTEIIISQCYVSMRCKFDVIRRVSFYVTK